MGIPLRGDWRGVSSPGRGQAPSSVPSPRRDIHHGPVHVGTLEKSRIRLPTGYTHARLFPDIASTAPLPEGGGRGEGAGEAYGYPLRVSRREAYRYPPAGRGNLSRSGTTPVNPGKNPAPTPDRPRYFRTVTKKSRFGIEDRGDFRAFPSPGARGTTVSFSCGSYQRKRKFLQSDPASIDENRSVKRGYSPPGCHPSSSQPLFFL